MAKARRTRRSATAELVYATLRDDVLDDVDDAIGGLPTREGRKLLDMLIEDLTLRHNEFEGYYGRHTRAKAKR